MKTSERDEIAIPRSHETTHSKLRISRSTAVLENSRSAASATRSGKVDHRELLPVERENIPGFGARVWAFARKIECGPLVWKMPHT